MGFDFYAVRRSAAVSAITLAILASSQAHAQNAAPQSAMTTRSPTSW
jgi:hypothetical protein